jgi:hypothetical protein
MGRWKITRILDAIAACVIIVCSASVVASGRGGYKGFADEGANIRLGGVMMLGMGLYLLIKTVFRKPGA